MTGTDPKSDAAGSNGAEPAGDDTGEPAAEPVLGSEFAAELAAEFESIAAAIDAQVDAAVEVEADPGIEHRSGAPDGIGGRHRVIDDTGEIDDTADREILSMLKDSMSAAEYSTLVALARSTPNMKTLQATADQVRDDVSRLQSEIDLVPVLDGIRDLRDSLASYQSLEHSHVELAKITEFNHGMVTDRLVDLREEIAQLREEIARANSVAVTTSQAWEELSNAAASAGRPWIADLMSERSQRRTAVTMSVVVVISVLITAWSIRAYLQSGDLYSAVLGLVVVNLMGGAAILFHRR